MVATDHCDELGGVGEAQFAGDVDKRLCEDALPFTRTRRPVVLRCGLRQNHTAVLDHADCHAPL